MSEGIVGAPLGATPINPLWRLFFWVAAIFNFVIGLAGMLSPESTLDARIVGLLVFSFGVIYALVARDPRRFGPALWAGVIGKIGVVALLGPGQLGEGGSALLLGILGLDAFFALGFLAFLLTREDDG